MVGRGREVQGNEVGIEGIEFILRTRAANYRVATLCELESKSSAKSFADSGDQNSLLRKTSAALA